MHSASYRMPAYPMSSRVSGPLTRARDWMDARGKAAWIIAMILGFVFFWPLGLALLGYVTWSKRMFGCSNRQSRVRYYAPTTGNSAFDAYREETLKRLDQPVEYLDSAAYGRFMLEEIEREKGRVERLGLRTG